MSKLMQNIENKENINIEYANQIKELEEYLKIRQKLQTYCVVTNWTETEKQNKGKFLLVLDTEKKSIGVKHFRKDEFVKATEIYAELEKHKEHLDVVLVEAGSIKELKKGYPNYFADSRYFARLLSYFISKAS
jgi:predicted ATP-dependent protease